MRPPQDALELPCVQAALSRVNLAVQSASEGLYEASSGGGVLLMGNRVAHPISQVKPCDFIRLLIACGGVALHTGSSDAYKVESILLAPDSCCSDRGCGLRANSSRKTSMESQRSSSLARVRITPHDTRVCPLTVAVVAR